VCSRRLRRPPNSFDKRGTVIKGAAVSSVEHILKTVFGFDHFRGVQEEVVGRVMTAYQERDQRPPEPPLGPPRDELMTELATA